MNGTASNSTAAAPCSLLYCALSTEERVIIIVLMFFIAALSLLGNSLVCSAYVTGKKKTSAITLSSLNVAVSNLLLTLFWGPSLTLYFYLVGKWVLGAFMCKLMAFVQHVAVVASLLHLLAVTVEKYWAVCFPYAFRRKRKLTRYSSVVFTWVIAVSVSAYYASFRITLTPDNGQTYFCIEDWSRDGSFAVVLTNIVLFFATLLAVVVLLGLTIYELRFGKGNFRPVSSATDAESSRSRKRARQARAVKILAVTLVSVLVCWTPFHILGILQLQDHMALWSLREVHLVYAACAILFFAVCTVHPFVFFFMNQRGRELVQAFSQRRGSTVSRRARSGSESTNLSLRIKLSPA